MNILIADDNELNRKLLRSMLEERGHLVHEVSDGKGALKYLAGQTSPSLAILDWEMPELEGIEVCRAMRRSDGSPFVYIILLTIRGDHSDVLAGLESGADDYITKPFDQKELLARVQIGVRMVKLQEALTKRVQELEMANEELEAFSRSVSHDLRAPLAGIEGLDQLLIDGYADKLDAQAQEYLADILASAKHMRHLIDDLLNLSHASKLELYLEEVSLTALVETIARELKKEQPDRAVEFVIAQGVKSAGDARLYRIALENLLRNAWKFSAKRKPARIEFGVQTSDGPPRYFVRDNGAGFDPAKAKKLFGLFQRLHSQSEFTGTGIGLTIVKRIMQRHGGNIWAEAVLGQGAVFYFTLSK